MKNGPLWGPNPAQYRDHKLRDLANSPGFRKAVSDAMDEHQGIRRDQRAQRRNTCTKRTPALAHVFRLDQGNFAGQRLMPGP